MYFVTTEVPDQGPERSGVDEFFLPDLWRSTIFSVFTCGFLGVFAKEEEGKEEVGHSLTLFLRPHFNTNQIPESLPTHPIIHTEGWSFNLHILG